MIEKLWFYPPLAFARVGRSRTPCPNYTWGPSDTSPRGTGKTTLIPAETLSLDAAGVVTSETPAAIRFKDPAGFRPICPFFELHGRYQIDGQVQEGPITVAVLSQLGTSLSEVRWSVRVANWKAYHYTLSPEDRVEATVELRGDQTLRTSLEGRSPVDGSIPAAQRRPLAGPAAFVPLGSVQVARAEDPFPELRIRFYPATGSVYGPSNLMDRSNEFPLPPERLILNPSARWCQWQPEDDARTNPSGLYASDEEGISLGLLDDVCDGIVSCRIGAVEAFARVAVGPPDYAPDRRPFTSLADGLADRVKRSEVSDPAYVQDLGVTTLEVRDLMERVLETMELTNLDAQNDRARGENSAIAQSLGLAPDAAANRAFPVREPVLGRPLPLTEFGRQRHRRFVALEVFEAMLRERPDLIDQWIREPMTGDRYYDQRMPALMRGSDRHPMHVTRRQFELLKAWAQRLRQEAEEGS